MIGRKSIIKQFNTLDADGSGQVDAAELMKLMSTSDQEVIRNVLTAMDRDLNGTISLAEYIHWCSPEDVKEQTSKEQTKRE